MKVLIVDDEIDLSLLLKSYFVKKGFTVLMSHTLEDGLNKIAAETPDVVLLDNNLPDATGWQEAPNIAAQHPNTFLFLISAYHPNIPFMPSLQNFQVLEKPISLSSFEGQLERIMEARRNLSAGAA